MMAETPLRRNVASAEVRSGIYRSGVLEAHVDRHDIQSLVLVAEGAKPVGHIRTYTGEAVEQLFKDLGLEYVSLKSGDGNKRSYYISRSRNLIERALVLSLSDDSDAVEAGALLGYEPCCVKAYAAKDSMGRNLHTVMLYERMESEMRLAGTDSNLLNIFTLNTYIPCSGSCEASIAHARTNKKLLDEVYPGLTQRMLNHERRST
ncbi:MAG: hypothetical protein M1504_00300 [Candidatus Marsarchaeota archaeon]|nr:hypothetical protein [Candidatus Marsarchaeota archaeon]